MADKLKLLFYGDSITDADRVRELPTTHQFSYGMGYVMQIAGKIIPECPEKYEIINRGVSGNKITDLHARLRLDVWNNKPDVLTILVGVNDVWHEVNNNNGVDIERFEKLYDMLLEDTMKRLPNTKIILMEPFVLKGSATEEKYDKFLDVLNYAKIVKKLAKKYNLPIVLLQDKFNEATKTVDAKYYLHDGVHPNVAGAVLIANEWVEIAKKENIL